MQAFLSAYDAHRAAQLAGIPERTLYDWAAKRLVVPSISDARPHMRWSYSDLAMLRLIDWLRRDKAVGDQGFARTTMTQIRDLLATIEGYGEKPGDREGRAKVEVTTTGRVVLTVGDSKQTPLHFGAAQGLFPSGELDLLAAYGKSGPDLIRPRDHLRIVPGILAGQPHIEDKRVPTDMVKDLSDQGFSVIMILRAYPTLTEVDVRDAIDFEEGLRPAA